MRGSIVYNILLKMIYCGRHHQQVNCRLSDNILFLYSLPKVSGEKRFQLFFHLLSPLYLILRLLIILMPPYPSASTL